jgi:beta-phosphoglucomutase
MIFRPYYSFTNKESSHSERSEESEQPGISLILRCAQDDVEKYSETDMNDSLAAIFDMDGVLVDTYHAHYRSWLEMAESEGLHFTEAQFALTFGRTSREIIAHFWGKDRCDPAHIAELDRQKEAAFRRIIEADFPAMPGARELLAALHESGFKLAVGSSGPPRTSNWSWTSSAPALFSRRS